MLFSNIQPGNVRGEYIECLLFDASISSDHASKRPWHEIIARGSSRKREYIPRHAGKTSFHSNTSQ